MQLVSKSVNTRLANIPFTVILWTNRVRAWPIFNRAVVFDSDTRITEQDRPLLMLRVIAQSLSNKRLAALSGEFHFQSRGANFNSNAVHDATIV